MVRDICSQEFSCMKEAVGHTDFVNLQVTASPGDG